MLRQDKKLRFVVLVSGWLGWAFGIAESGERTGRIGGAGL